MTRISTRSGIDGTFSQFRNTALKHLAPEAERRANLNRTALMTQGLVPGKFVRHPDQPDWGVGQIQSVINGRATVNFEHAGKRVIVLAAVTLVAAEPANNQHARTDEWHNGD